MKNVFSETKGMITMPEIMNKYRITIIKKGKSVFSLCPFHQEKTPSFQVFKNGYHCFGCGESGDIIKFVEKYFDMSPINAVRRINDDFGLRLFEGNYTFSKQHRDDLNQDRALKKGFEVWKNTTYDELCKIYRNTNKILNSMKPIDDGYSETLRSHQYVEMLIEKLQSGIIEEIIQIYLDLGNKYCRGILGR